MVVMFVSCMTLIRHVLDYQRIRPSTRENLAPGPQNNPEIVSVSHQDVKNMQSI